jgi:hypothetical protein
MPYSMRYPTTEDIKVLFDELYDSSDGNIKGVLSYGSGSRHNLGISICTHGNELSGLACLWAFKELGLQQRLEDNKVTFILANRYAARQYIDSGLDLTEPYLGRQFRFIDTNMNRLPINLENPNQSIEIQRAIELGPVILTFSSALDFHSTDNDEVPMLITVNSMSERQVRVQNIPTVLQGVSTIQRNIPFCSLFGRREIEIPILGVETGVHNSENSFLTAIDCMLREMQRCFNVNFPSDFLTKTQLSEKVRYEIFDSIISTSPQFRVARVFKNLEKVAKGELLSIDQNVSIFATQDCYPVFVSGGGNSLFRGEEVAFLARRVE